MFLTTFFMQRHRGNASTVQVTFAPTCVRKWVSALMYTVNRIWFWFLEPDFWNQRFQCNFESLQPPWPEGPPTGGATGSTSTGGSVHFMQSHRSPMPLSNFFSKRRRVVLDAGPLLEPPVPPLVRLRAARGPWCGASVGTTGSAPRALACCPEATAMSCRRCAWFSNFHNTHLVRVIIPHTKCAELENHDFCTITSRKPNSCLGNDPIS